MGDRCYMSIVCRHKDRKAFEDLGFGDAEYAVSADGQVAFDKSDALPDLVMLEETEANYAYSGRMPTDVPWYGSSGQGDSYGPSVYACDGTGEICELEASDDGHPMCGIVIVEGKPQPNPEDMEIAAKYFDMLARTRRSLGMNPIPDWKPLAEEPEPDPADANGGEAYTGGGMGPGNV